MEEDSREDFNNRIRRGLCDLFGPFDEFHERVAKNQQTSRHGLIRGKMKQRPYTSLQLPAHDSPSHIPVHVALQSMRNLVDEPLSALPHEFSELKKTTGNVKNSTDKKRKMEDDENQIEAKRKKESNMRNSIPSSTPDSGVHSTESDLQEEPNSDEIAAMLSIMKTLDEPKLSPIPESVIKEFKKERSSEKEKEREKEKPREIKPTRFLSDSPVSSASTSREQTPEPKTLGSLKLKGLKPEKVQKLIEMARSRGKLTAENGEIVKPLEKPIEKSIEKPMEKPIEKPIEKPPKSSKSEKVKEKKIVEEQRPSTSLPILPPPPRPPSVPSSMTPSVTSSVTSSTTPSATTTTKDVKSSSIPPEAARNSPLPPQKPPNKTVQNLQNQRQIPSRSLSPSGPSPRSIRSTTPSVHSRPSSSLSTHENQQQNHVVRSVTPEKTPKNHVASVRSVTPERMPTPTPAVATTSTVTPSKTRWICQWDHSRLKKIQRVPIPDPTTSTKSKGEFYHSLAKDWKSQADRSKDRIVRPLNYMLSSVFFVLEAIWKAEKERTAQARMQCASIYRDTYELLGVAVFQGIRDTDDALSVHILPRIKVLGQIMLSVMQYQMYLFRAEQAIKNMSRLEMREVTESIDVRPVSRASDSSSVHSQNLTVPTNKAVISVAQGTPKPIPSAGSTPSGPTGVPISPWVASVQACQNTVTMPQIVFDAYKSQIKTSNALILASRYWEDSKALARYVDSTFIKDIETVCGKSIGMDMPFDTLAQFVLTAVGSLKAEYEEEKKQSIKPILAKIKKGLEYAIRTGTFHSDRPPPIHRPSQSTPQPAGQDVKPKPKV